jgi:hypothetical protein
VVGLNVTAVRVAGRYNTGGQLHVTAAGLTGTAVPTSAPSLFGSAEVTHTSDATAAGYQNPAVEVTHTHTVEATGTSARFGVVTLELFVTATVPPAGSRFRLRKTGGGSSLRDGDRIKGGIPQVIGGAASVTHTATATVTGTKGGGSRLQVTAVRVEGQYNVGTPAEVTVYQQALATGYSTRNGVVAVVMSTQTPTGAGTGARFGPANVPIGVSISVGAGSTVGTATMTMVSGASATGIALITGTAEDLTPLDYKSFLEYRNTR